MVRAINLLSLKELPLEMVELLQRMVPTEEETKLYNAYIADRKDVAALTDEDQYLIHLCRVERLANKLAVMAYMGNFFDNIHLIQPVSTLGDSPFFFKPCFRQKVKRKICVIQLN